MQNRRIFLKQISAGSLGLIFTLTHTHCSGLLKRPNIVLMVADDLGWDDLSLHNNQYVETPSLDKLAKESVQFNKFYVNPVCAPTRASLLTGRHFLRTGISHVHGGKDFMALDEVTIAQVLAKNGYATAMWGKWHSGKTDGYFPWQRGFDQAYMAQLYKHENSAGMLNGRPVEHKKWTTDVLTDYAIDFITLNKNQRFFAYVPFLSCHSPLAAQEDYIHKYEQKGLSRNLATVYAMVERIDRNVKRILEKLDELALSDNTVVIFISDNGPAINNNELTDEDRKIRYVNKFRGHKGNTWDNGVRSPLFVRWSNYFSPAHVERLVDACDLFPTILDLAGIHYRSPKPLDGRSIKPFLYGETQSLSPKLSFNYAGPGWPPTDQPWTPEGVMDEYRPISPEGKASLAYKDQIISVQDERYKLLHNPGSINNMPELVDGYALFDMEADPRQLHNIIKKHPDIATWLQSELKKWWQSILNEKNAFAMPIFQIGLNGSIDSEVPAYGPQQVSSNTICAFNYITLPGTGDYAEYQLQVHTAGLYRIVMNFSAEQQPGTLLKLSAQDQQVTARLEESREQELGGLDLVTGEYILKIEIIKADDSTPALLKANNMIFTRV